MIKMIDHKKKRFLERWLADKEFRKVFNEKPKTALKAFDIDVDLKEIEEFCKNKSEKDLKKKALKLLYLKIQSQLKINIKTNFLSNNPIFKMWFYHRWHLFLKNQRYIIIPFAIELSKGCSVGCSFCGFSAGPLEEYYSYDSLEWQKILQILKKICGKDSTKLGVCYYATDPFDNPDYEKFILDFKTIFGSFPATTSAQYTKNISRTKKFLKLLKKNNCDKAKASITSLKMLNTFHSNFSSEELKNLYLVLQLDDCLNKHVSGRARNLYKSHKENKLNVPIKFSSNKSLSCLTGFLLNMVDKTVKLVAPCAPSDKWPLGYIIFEEKVFENPPHLEKILNEMIAKNMAKDLAGF